MEEISNLMDEENLKIMGDAIKSLNPENASVLGYLISSAIDETYKILGLNGGCDDINGLENDSEIREDYKTINELVVSSPNFSDRETVAKFYGARARVSSYLFRKAVEKKQDVVLALKESEGSDKIDLIFETVETCFDQAFLALGLMTAAEQYAHQMKIFTQDEEVRSYCRDIASKIGIDQNYLEKIMEKI